MRQLCATADLDPLAAEAAARLARPWQAAQLAEIDGDGGPTGTSDAETAALARGIEAAVKRGVLEAAE
jgi:hypothetical protein